MSHYLKQAEYYEFTRWFAIPSVFRDPPDQKGFQMLWNVSGDTLARWKHDPDFWEDVGRAMRAWAKEKTPDVIAGIYRAAVKGNPASQKLWMQIFEDFVEKNQHDHTGKVEIRQVEEKRQLMILQAFTNFGLLENLNSHANDTTIQLPDSRGDNQESGGAPGSG